MAFGSGSQLRIALCRAPRRQTKYREEAALVAAPVAGCSQLVKRSTNEVVEFAFANIGGLDETNGLFYLGQIGCKDCGGIGIQPSEGSRPECQSIGNEFHELGRALGRREDDVFALRKGAIRA